MKYLIIYAHLSPRLLCRGKYQDSVMSSRFGTGYYLDSAMHGKINKKEGKCL
jgi:hypothetical protein